MKKCDLHIHTIPTVSDSHFDFSLEVLEDYVNQMQIDVVAITNHNKFHLAQYLQIRDRLDEKTVLPGIEVDLEGGHILVIANKEDADLYDFNAKCEAVSAINTKNTDTMSLDSFKSIFTDLNKYVLIPHYDKSPSVPKPIITALSNHIHAGEVTSVKKFLYMQKQEGERLTPVIFSDSRFAKGMTLEDYPLRQTYLDINEISVNALNLCLRDKSNATLTAQDGNNLFTIFSNGQVLSTGLNIMFGRRSTGKTWTMDRIASKFGDRAKYIRQFELQNYGRRYSSEQFESDQKVRLESEVNTFLKPFKDVVEDVAVMPTEHCDVAEIDSYLQTLLRRSQQENENDVFSKSVLYDEIAYPIKGTTNLRKVIDSVITLMETSQYRDVIDKYLHESSLKLLLKDLILKLRAKEAGIKYKSYTNSILNDVKNGLQIHSALSPIPDIDLYSIALRSVKRKKFSTISTSLKRPRVVYDESMLQFRIKVSTRPYNSASDAKMGLSIGQSIQHAFDSYDSPLGYLKRLVDAGVETSKLHRLFVGINYQILNSSGHNVSGGEQSEFTFLQKIKDAKTKDILLIDEPESSFDNVFLKRDINRFIKDMAAEMPVLVSTHNNTIGGSIKPDYILYADKSEVEGKTLFRLYSGFPTDKQLKTVDGETIDNYEITISSLEAGEDAYKERNSIYEALKD